MTHRIPAGQCRSGNCDRQQGEMSAVGVRDGASNGRDDPQNNGAAVLDEPNTNSKVPTPAEADSTGGGPSFTRETSSGVGDISAWDDLALLAGMKKECIELHALEAQFPGRYHRLGTFIVESRRRFGDDRVKHDLRQEGIGDTRAWRAEQIATLYTYEQAVAFPSLRAVLKTLPAKQPREKKAKGGGNGGVGTNGIQRLAVGAKSEDGNAAGEDADRGSSGGKPAKPRGGGENTETPPNLCQWIFERLEAASFHATTILDPCAGRGNLTRPFRGSHIIAYEITFGHDFFGATAVDCDLVLCNPPWLQAEKWLPRIVEVVGSQIPIVYIAPAMYMIGYMAAPFRRYLESQVAPPLHHFTPLPINTFPGAHGQGAIYWFNLPDVRNVALVPSRYLIRGNDARDILRQAETIPIRKVKKAVAAGPDENRVEVFEEI